MPTEQIVVLPGSGQRLDQALTEALADFSRAQVQRLIKDGMVRSGTMPVKASQRLEEPLTVVVTLLEVQETALVAENIPLTILYEDENMLVVDKPAGLVVHPAPGHDSGTLVNAVLHHCPDLPGVGGERRPGIVHRLDKDTSGLIVVAKHDQALRHLQAQFKARTVAKTYLALVEGTPNPAAGEIDAPIGRNPRQRKRMAVIRPGTSATARAAQTSYETLTAYDDFTLVACYPHTGRTHQIRVHMHHIGHPLVGDTIYGRRNQQIKLRRHFLHASGLTLRRPGDDAEMTWTSPLPTALQRVVDRLAKT